MAIYEKALGPEHPWTRTVRENYRDVREKLGAVDEILIMPNRIRAALPLDARLGPRAHEMPYEQLPMDIFSPAGSEHPSAIVPDLPNALPL